MTLEPQSETPAAGVPSELAPETAKPARSPGSIRDARERIVLLCMGLVTAATAAALYVVYGFSIGSAVLGACGVWAALMTIHLQLKKDGEIKRLKAELHRLERQTASGLGPRPKPPMSAQPADAGAPMRGPAKQTATAPEGSLPDSEGLSAPTTLSLDPSPRWVAPGQTPGVHDAKPQQGALSSSRPVQHAGRDGPVSPPAADAALWPGTEISPSDPMRDQWAFRPRQDQETPGPAKPAAAGKPVSVEADLEMVQRKIKALAEEVNAADAERARQANDNKANPRKGAAAPRTSMIEDSIGALKSAATSMRAKSQPETQKPDALPTAEAPATPSKQAPLSLDDLIPKTAQTIAASKPGTSRNPLPPLPELDLPPLPAPDLSAPEPQVSPRIAAIADALQHGEMDVFLSPIVALQSHEVSHYDVTVRLRNRTGGYMDDAEQELRLAGSDLLALFDTARIKRAAILARRLEAHQKKGSLLSAVNGGSMTNAEFLEAFARVFEERDQISNQLVLTFSQADIEQFSPSAWQALGDMHAFGFRFALSKIDHAGMDFAALSKHGFAFLRLNAGALLNGLPARDHFMGPDELCRKLAGAGMTLVADTIDDEAIRARIFGFGILFGQGRLFGGARQIKLDPIPSSSSAAA